MRRIFLLPKFLTLTLEQTFRSGNHPFFRTEARRNAAPFGKPPRNPNGLLGKCYSVREITLKPERTPRKVLLR